MGDEGLDRRLVELTSELVRAPSVLGDEGEAAKIAAAAMRDLGFDEVEIDGSGNAVGVVRGDAAGPTILLDAHMDTVDVMPRDAWTRDPFGGEVDGGRVWGRGASDMKGALAAMICAVGSLDRSSVRGSAVVSASVLEETLEGRALREVMDRHEPDFVVIGEASGLDLVRAGRGRAEFVLEARGVPSHASTPSRGVNAVHRMIDAVREIETLPMVSDSFVGSGVMCLTDIVSEPYPAHSVVPSGCRATYERRLVPGETLDGTRAELTAACERAGAADTEISLAMARVTTYTGIEWTEPKWLSPWEMAHDHALVQRALAGLRKASLDPGLSSYQFCTNAAYSIGVAGIPTIGFGPSTEALAHVVDEYLEIADLVAACAGYRYIVESVLD